MLSSPLPVVFVNAKLRTWLRGFFGSRKKPVLIYGAGIAGQRLHAALQASKNQVPVAFIDRDWTFRKRGLLGYRVFPHHKLREVVQAFGIEELILGLPGDSTAQLRERKEIIGEILRLDLKVPLKTIPCRAALPQDEVRFEEIRDVDVGDLLGRAVLQPDSALTSACIFQKSVLVTGAGGSIGSELCRQILKQQPARLVLLDMNEHHLYQIDRELKRQTSVPCVPLLGSVLDRDLLRRLFRKYRAQTVYHAAGYKHVHLVEENPVVGVRNNVMGTYLLALEAVAAGVETFIKISTDKAYRPTGVMGASKRLAEMVLQAMAKREDSRTRFTVVRFGNVLESSGSVVPLFREQIAKGDKVTVTDPRATRFLMTLSEAVALVLQAGAMGGNGDLLFLEMGEPVNILQLAETMIRLAGYSLKRPGSGQDGIAIEITGLRPGEKLHEELPTGDRIRPTGRAGILRIAEEIPDYSDIQTRLSILGSYLDVMDGEAVCRFLAELIGTEVGTGPPQKLSVRV